MKLKELLSDIEKDIGDSEVISHQTEATNIVEEIKPEDSRYKNTGLRGENEILIATELTIKIRLTT